MQRKIQPSEFLDLNGSNPLVCGIANRYKFPGEITMQAFLAACCIALVVALGSYFVLDGVQKTAEQGYSSSTGVRL